MWGLGGSEGLRFMIGACGSMVVWNEGRHISLRAVWNVEEGVTLYNTILPKSQVPNYWVHGP